VIIAALTQWRTISIFHLFICSNLASTIPIFNHKVTRMIDPRSSQSLLQTAYFAYFGMLRLAISAYLIYRFRFWGNKPGQCFIIPHAPPHIDVRVPLILGTALRIVWDLSYFPQALGQFIMAIQGRDQIQRTVQDFLQDQKQKSAWTRMTYVVIACVVNVFFPYVVPFIWNAYWTITIVLANRGHILGDEYIYTFGQVVALVAFVASFYAIGSSYLRKRCRFMIMPFKKLITKPQSIESNQGTPVLVT